MKRLIILTQEFPYGNGESFLEDELKVYSEKGRSVVLVPYKISGKPRNLPPGVVTFDNESKDLSLFQFVFSLSLSFWFWEEFLKKGYFLFFKESRTSFLFFLKLSWITKKTLQKLNNVNPVSDQDVLYSYWLGGLTGGAILFSKVLETNCFIVSRAHGGDLYENRYNPSYLPFRTFLLKNVSMVAVVSRNGTAYLKSLYPAFRNRIETHYLGTPEPGFISQPSMDGILRIVSCSFISALKRLDLLIDGLKALSVYNPKIVVLWTHIGGGEALQKTQAYAENRFGKRGSVSFRFLGNLRHEEIMDFYRFNSVDLFLSTSSSEGIPVSMMEAMSVGIPVVSTNVGGVSELVDDSMLLSANPTDRDIAKVIYDNFNYLTSNRAESIRKWSSDFNARKNYSSFLDRLVVMVDNASNHGKTQ